LATQPRQNLRVPLDRIAHALQSPNDIVDVVRSNDAGVQSKKRLLQQVIEKHPTLAFAQTDRFRLRNDLPSNIPGIAHERILDSRGFGGEGWSHYESIFDFEQLT